MRSKFKFKFEFKFKFILRFCQLAVLQGQSALLAVCLATSVLWWPAQESWAGRGQPMSRYQLPWIVPVKYIDSMHRLMATCTGIVWTQNLVSVSRHCGLHRSEEAWAGNSKEGAMQRFIMSDETTLEIKDNSLNQKLEKSSERDLHRRSAENSSSFSFIEKSTNGVETASTDIALLLFRDPVVLDPSPFPIADELPWNQQFSIVGYGRDIDQGFLYNIKNMWNVLFDQSYDGFNKKLIRANLQKTPENVALARDLGAIRIHLPYEDEYPFVGDSGGPAIFTPSSAGNQNTPNTAKIFGAVSFVNMEENDVSSMKVYLTNLTLPRVHRFFQKAYRRQDDMPGVCCRCHRKIYSTNANQGGGSSLPIRNEFIHALHLLGSQPESETEIQQQDQVQQNEIEAQNICQKDVGKSDYLTPFEKYEVESCEPTERSACYRGAP